MQVGCLVLAAFTYILKVSPRLKTKLQTRKRNLTLTSSFPLRCGGSAKSWVRRRQLAFRFAPYGSIMIDPYRADRRPHNILDREKR